MIGTVATEVPVEVKPETLRSGPIQKEPWDPVSVSVDTGVACLGVAGVGDALLEVAAMGDEVTIAARNEFRNLWQTVTGYHEGRRRVDRSFKGAARMAFMRAPVKAIGGHSEYSEPWQWE